MIYAYYFTIENGYKLKFSSERLRTSSENSTNTSIFLTCYLAENQTRSLTFKLSLVHLSTVSREENKEILEHLATLLAELACHNPDPLLAAVRPAFTDSTTWSRI